MREDNLPDGEEKKRGSSTGDAEKLKRNWEQLKERVNALYPKLNAVKAPLLAKKFNDDKYEHVTFIDAMDFTVTSNALSLMRSIYQNSVLSATAALCARNIIEALVLIKMKEDGVITEADEELFPWQYALMEYDTYYKDGEKFKYLLDLKALTERYEIAKKIYNDAGICGGVERGRLRQAIRTRVPFLCKHREFGRRVNFNTLLKMHMPPMLSHYEVLSYYAHPNYNSKNKSRHDYFIAIMAVMDAVAERYKNHSHGRAELLSDKMDRLFNQNYPENAVPNRLQYLMREQCDILSALAEGFEKLHYAVFKDPKEDIFLRANDNYLTRFFSVVSTTLYDMTYDYLLNLRECVKIKFKAVAEAFAHYDRVITETINSRGCLYGVQMLKRYELVTAFKQKGESVPEGCFREICELYFENYPQELYHKSSVYFDKKTGKDRDEENRDKVIIASFCQPLGNFLDGNGNVPKYLDLIDEYFKDTFGDEPILDIEYFMKEVNNEAEEDPSVQSCMSERDKMNMYYKESNNLSHACGYLYFANYGALRDDGPIMQALDYMVSGAVKKVIKEIEKWQKEHGKEEHYTINKFLDSLKGAEERLVLIAMQKTVLYQAGAAE